MKKNLISIVLLVGMLALNAGALTKAPAQAGLKDAHIEAQAAAHVFASCIDQHDAGLVAALVVATAHCQHAFECGCVTGDPGAHLDFDTTDAATGLAPVSRFAQAVAAVFPASSNQSSDPQYRPPRPRLKA